MNIDWAALGSVFGVSLVATVGLVGLFTLGVVGLAKPTAAKPTAAGQTAADQGSGERGSANQGSGGAVIRLRAGAYTCFALCAAAVAYGIFLIVA
jgi:hypothetical protein